MMNPLWKVIFLTCMESHDVITSRHEFLSLTLSPCFSAEDEEGRGKMSRSEKKARKAISKLAMKPVVGVQRVQIRKSKNVRIKQTEKERERERER